MTTLAEAYKILAAVHVPTYEVLDLLQDARCRRLTPESAARLVELAVERASIAAIQLLPVVELLVKAQAAQKRAPKITLQLADGSKLVLKLVGERSTKPGTVTVTDGGSFESGTFYGRIYSNGTVEESRSWTPEVETALRQLAANPAVVAAQHGVATGSCCFCCRPLSTKESRSVGYGPDCASKYGLPWGDTTVADEAHAAAVEAQAAAIETNLKATFAAIAEKRKAADAEHQAAWHPRNDDPLIDELAVSPARHSANTTFEQSKGRYTGSRRAGD